MLTVRNLSLNYDGFAALSKISLQIDEGDFVAVVGMSGSGKTSLLKCLSFRQKWDSGQFIYRNKEITSLSLPEKLKLRKEWAYVEEKPKLNLYKSALKNVLSGRFFHTPVWRLLTGSRSKDEHMLAADYLEQVGLLDKADVIVEKLSGGERQRVAVAKALVQGAHVIYADEPVSGLDPQAAEGLMKDLKKCCASGKTTIVISLSDVELAEKHVTRIIGIHKGKVVADVHRRRLTQKEKDLIF